MAAKSTIEIRVEVLEQTLEMAIKQIEALEAKLETLTTRRGPKSSREMTLEDAERIINGDLKETSHKKAAEILGAVLWPGIQRSRRVYLQGH
jgi:3-dehydroquinate dehydratase